MITLIIDVASEDEALAQAIERNEPPPPRYLFCSQEDLLDTLTGNRFALLKALAGAGPLGVRELARRTGRDVRVVHADAKRLAGIGLIDKTADGKLSFPYDAVRVELAFQAAA